MQHTVFYALHLVAKFASKCILQCGHSFSPEPLLINMLHIANLISVFSNTERVRDLEIGKGGKILK